MKTLLKSLFVFCVIAMTATAALAQDDNTPDTSAGHFPMLTVHPLHQSQGYVPQCYTHEEAVAEQGIRIHSELMVIGLNCQHLTPAGQQNLYAQYRDLTNRNAHLFATWENILINYFKRSGAPNPEANFNTMRTELANTVANDSAHSRPDLFCQHYMPRIQKAASMSGADLEKWAGTFFPGHPTTHPLCPGQ